MNLSGLGGGGGGSESSSAQATSTSGNTFGTSLFGGGTGDLVALAAVVIVALVILKE